MCSSSSPRAAFDYEETVTVSVSASDLAGNAITLVR